MNKPIFLFYKKKIKYFCVCGNEILNQKVNILKYFYHSLSFEV